MMMQVCQNWGIVIFLKSFPSLSRVYGVLRYMNSATIHPPVSRFFRSVYRTLLDIVHLMVSYLGIAVLVAVLAAALLPAIRDQIRVIHQASLHALMPDSTVMSDRDLLTIFSAPQVRQGNLIKPDPAEPAEEQRSTALAREQDYTAEGFFANLGISDSQFTVPGVSNNKALALREYVSRKYKIARNVTGALIRMVYSVAEKQDLDPILLLGVIAIESRYNPFAESHVGAQGLMQVMPKVHAEKFDVFHGGVLSALNPVANVHVGAKILHDCIARRGSVDRGLACYVGAIGPNDGGYADKVQSERRRIALESGIALQRSLGGY